MMILRWNVWLWQTMKMFELWTKQCCMWMVSSILLSKFSPLHISPCSYHSKSSIAKTEKNKQTHTSNCAPEMEFTASFVCVWCARQYCAQKCHTQKYLRILQEHYKFSVNMYLATYLYVLHTHCWHAICILAVFGRKNWSRLWKLDISDPANYCK